jgi:hypothetical protein
MSIPTRQTKALFVIRKQQKEKKHLHAHTYGI